VPEPSEVADAAGVHVFAELSAERSSVVGNRGVFMRTVVERAGLAKSLGHVHRVVERRNTIPILGNVLLRADGARLELKATDLDLEVVESIAADVQLAGATTVPAHMFYDIVRKLPEGAEISLEADAAKGTLVIRAGRARFQLQTLPEADFPDLTAGEFGHRFTLTATELKRLVDKTQFAISTEETRYYLNGIYLHTEPMARCCARWPPTATASPRSSSPPRRAQSACRA
jgi:DNA polymerase-3 subunit beta